MRFNRQDRSRQDRNRQILPFLGAIALTLLLPIVAQAHPGHPDHNMGFLYGLQHPWNGLDHILAMVAVGLWAAQIGGQAIWAVPFTFIGTMTIAASLGMMGLTIPGIEQGIVLSDFILGGLVLAATRLPLSLSMLLVAILASFHGNAHGAEMPSTVSGLAYGGGFILSTALLHGIGIGAVQLLKTKTATRWVGGAIVVASCYVLINQLLGA
jgi:urease accessory protein